MKRSLIFPMAMVLGMCTGLFAQTPDRPKIGLVLSGGGAKGMAHIGILKELEELGIRPDYITGTSMGSVIGGLYAAGYSADEIRAIALDIDWSDLLSNQIPLNQISFEEKEYYQRYLIELGVTGSRIELPRGLIEGQHLSEMLSSLTRHVQAYGNFNDLPIPFACVATDISTGEAYVMHQGSLPLSIRASMAIPSIFTPVIIDGRLLVDGGLVRNFPVQECLDMGADIIIGVFVSDELSPKEDLLTAVDVLTQSAFVMSVFDSREQKKKCDLLIEPVLAPYSTFGFTDTDSIIARGEQAAVRYRPQLKALADSLGLRGRIPDIVRPEIRDTFLIRSVTIQNNNTISDRFIRGRLRIRAQDYVSLQQIETRIDVLYGTRYFDKVLYELRPAEEGDDLIVTVSESVAAQVKFALHYDTENKAGMNLNLTRRNLIAGSRALLEADFAESPRINGSFLKYVGQAQNRMAIAGIKYRNSDINLRDDRSVENAIFVNKYLNPYLGWYNTGRVRRNYGVKIQYENSALRPKVAGDLYRMIDLLRWKSWSVVGEYRKSTLNSRYFAKRGSTVDLSLKYTFHTAYRATLADTSGNKIDLNFTPGNFTSLNVSHEIRWELGRHLVLALQDAMMMNFIDREEAISPFPYFNDQIFVGGFRPLLTNSLPFWGGNQLEFNLDHVFYNGLILQYSPVTKVYLEVTSQYINALYPMKWFYEKTEESQYYLPDDNHALWGYGAQVSYMTPIGPVSLAAASHAGTSHWNVFFNIGFYF